MTNIICCLLVILVCAILCILELTIAALRQIKKLISIIESLEKDINKMKEMIK